LCFFDADNILVIRRNVLMNKTSDPINGLFERVGFGADITAGHIIVSSMIQQTLDDGSYWVPVAIKASSLF
jgi:hypothetical protein